MISKNVKNSIEAKGMLDSHIRDAVAVCKFAAHLEKEIKSGSENWTEISASKLLLDYRLQNPGSPINVKKKIFFCSNFS